MPTTPDDPLAAGERALAEGDATISFRPALVALQLSLDYRDGLDNADVDLQLCALSELGAALVDQGRVVEGVRMLDEAMAGSLGGECTRPDPVVFTSCNTLQACTSCADFERAVQWLRATDRFAQRDCPKGRSLLCRRGSVPRPGHCSATAGSPLRSHAAQVTLYSSWAAWLARTASP